MREAYKQYIKEHPEELVNVGRLIKRSREIESARRKRRDQKLALIRKIREERLNEACDKRS